MHVYENRIKELCANALTAEGEVLSAILSELRIALREHTLRMENEVYSYPAMHPDPLS